MSKQPRQRRQLSPEEKWEVFLEVTSQELTQADTARKWRVDVSTVIKVRKLVRDAALAAFAASKPGRPRSVHDVEVEALRAENARLGEALKELAVELTLVRGNRGGVESRPRPVARGRRREGAAAQAHRRRDRDRLVARARLRRARRR